MPKSDLYRRQHQSIRTAVARLEATLDQGTLASDAGEARSALGALAGTLRIHLASEDKSLYPVAAESADAGLQELARRLQTEMGGLSSAFRSYVDDWPTPAYIQAAPSEFLSASRDIVRVLAKRMEREESEFYPRIDAA